MTLWDVVEARKKHFGLTAAVCGPQRTPKGHAAGLANFCSLEGQLWTEILSYREGGGEISRRGLTTLLASPDYPDHDPEWLPRSHAIMAMSKKSVHPQADADTPCEIAVRIRGHVHGEQIGTHTTSEIQAMASQTTASRNGLQKSGA